jgi:tRNA(fMet)-specific endonuclease VapC
MTYLLNTNACISHMNVRSSPVAARLRAHQPGDIVICSVVRAELIYKDTK